MAFVRGADVVTNGLVISLDAANPKSYTTGSTIIRDLTNLNNSGSFRNGVGFSYEKDGVIRFDGLNDDVLVNYSQNPTYFTVELVVKATISSGTRVFLGKYNGVGDDYWVGVSSTNIVFSTNGSVLSSGVAINTTEYFIICAVLGATQRKIYVNGINRNSVDTTTTSPGGRLTLGSFGELGGFFSGMNLSSFRFYNRELNDFEILQNYNATKARFGID